jgi:kynurenine formamidase
VQIHGFDVTHLDALGHVYFEGRAYNGRQVGSIVSDEGLAFASICGMRDGIVTRGILLDIAEVRGVDMLGKGEGVSLEDVLEAERRGGVAVQRGDAIFIRSGIGLDKRWRDGSSIAGRPGVLPEVIPWIFDRQVSVYSGDCIEQLPDIGDAGDMPLHETGLVAMGLAILDNPDVEALLSVCNELGRREFMLTVAPLRIPGGTGSAVNPLALF